MIQICLRTGAPFDNNEKRKISKKAVKEDHLWNKLIPGNKAEHLASNPVDHSVHLREREREHT